MNFIIKKTTTTKLCNAFKKFSNIYLMLDLYTYQNKRNPRKQEKIQL